MATYVLVHGGSVSTDTWNELTHSREYPPGERLGGKCWKHVAAGLQNCGHRVLTPTLPDEATHGLTDHVDQICSIIEHQADEQVVLVGHSYGGMVITGAAAAMPERIGVLAYLDADYPDSGLSLFDILKAGGLNPEEIVGGSPMAYTEKLIYDSQKLRSLKKAYILCTDSDFIKLTTQAMEKACAEKSGWLFFELHTGHLAQVTMPAQLTEILGGLVQPF